MYTYNVKPPTLFTLQEEQDKVREVVADVNEKVLLMLNDCSEESREVIVNLRAFFVDTVFEKFSLKDDGSGALIKYFFQREEVKKEDGETEEVKTEDHGCNYIETLRSEVSAFSTPKHARCLGYRLADEDILNRDQVNSFAENTMWRDAIMKGYDSYC